MDVFFRYKDSHLDAWNLSGMELKFMKQAHSPSGRSFVFFYIFLCYFPWTNFGYVEQFEAIVCNRFNKPQTLNIRDVHLHSLRGPNVLFSSQMAYGDGSTHVKKRGRESE
jgi:hypothetical protein